ncbi:transporter substrate-binding domain-containing protein [Achromobacter sp. DH1f]|uniref:transporter substrate-binding domain-containing protein n=1 Tax=Achromobacter sp. DH1f TaxID=1397275 RepID=UPI0009DCC9A8|nr:transporter substrate-binding domain-containing protein [Achromobacter sp. DH1f]
MRFHSLTRHAPTIAIVIAAFACTSARADATLDKIKQRGKLAVGVSSPHPPLGILDPVTGKTGGYQTELAADIARRLGVQLETVAVPSSTRVRLLQSGKIDLIIAAIGWTPERAEILSFAPTPYDVIGGVAMVPKRSGIRRWEDLRGKIVCVSQGSSYAKPLADVYGAVVKGLRGLSESLLALKGGACEASVHDYPELYSKLNDENAREWSDYTLTPQDALNPTPVVVWMRKGETDTQAFVDQAIQDWHRSGFVLQQARQWGMVDTWVASRHALALQGKFDQAPADFDVYKARQAKP